MKDDPDTSAGVADVLLEANRTLWKRIVTHPFVSAAADGSLEQEAFNRWVVEDHTFVVGFRRFLAGLAALAPNEEARDALSSALLPLQAELKLFREEAARRGLDLEAEPGPTTLGYTSFVMASLQDGYEVALTVLYGAEKAYFDAWRAVRDHSQQSSPYWPFIENWSSETFGGWVDRLATLLDALTLPGPTKPMSRAFERVVRFELLFWDAVYSGERWNFPRSSSALTQ